MANNLKNEIRDNTYAHNDLKSSNEKLARQNAASNRAAADASYAAANASREAAEAAKLQADAVIQAAQMNAQTQANFSRQQQVNQYFTLPGTLNEAARLLEKANKIPQRYGHIARAQRQKTYLSDYDKIQVGDMAGSPIYLHELDDLTISKIQKLFSVEYLDRGQQTLDRLEKEKREKDLAAYNQRQKEWQAAKLADHAKKMKGPEISLYVGLMYNWGLYAAMVIALLYMLVNFGMVAIDFAALFSLVMVYFAHKAVNKRKAYIKHWGWLLSGAAILGVCVIFGQILGGLQGYTASTTFVGSIVAIIPALLYASIISFAGWKVYLKNGFVKLNEIRAAFDYVKNNQNTSTEESTKLTEEDFIKQAQQDVMARRARK